MISTRGRYALRLMIDLAENEDKNGGLVPLKDIAVRQEISKKYLEIRVVKGTTSGRTFRLCGAIGAIISTLASGMQMGPPTLSE